MPEYTCKWQTYNPTEGEHENVESPLVTQSVDKAEGWVEDRLGDLDTFNERLVVTVTKQ